MQHVRSCASATRSRRGPTSASISVPVLPETTAIDLSNTPAAIGGANPPRISTYWGLQSPSIPTTAPKCWNCRGGWRSDDEDDYGLDIEGLSQEGDSPTLTQHTPTDGVQNRTFTTNHPRQFGTGGEGRRASLARFGAQLAPENIDPVEAHVNKRSTIDGL